MPIIVASTTRNRRVLMSKKIIPSVMTMPFPVAVPTVVHEREADGTQMPMPSAAAPSATPSSDDHHDNRRDHKDGGDPIRAVPTGTRRYEYHKIRAILAQEMRTKRRYDTNEIKAALLIVALHDRRLTRAAEMILTIKFFYKNCGESERDKYKSIRGLLAQEMNQLYDNHQIRAALLLLDAHGGDYSSVKDMLQIARNFDAY
jgi:hypothetical protein